MISSNLSPFEFPFFCSWSGGKDSCLALHFASRSGAKPKYLLTMMIEDGLRSRSHGLTPEVLRAQAECLGIATRFRSTGWSDYEKNFVDEIQFFKSEKIMHGIFGDIDLEDHRIWVERVCSSRGVQAHLPLWKRARHELMYDLLAMEFRAEIVAVKDGVLSQDFLGRTIDSGTVKEFEAAGIDICGETGEYHTIVTNGPVFKNPLRIRHGERSLRDGYWFSDVSVLNL